MQFLLNYSSISKNFFELSKHFFTNSSFRKLSHRLHIFPIFYLAMKGDKHESSFQNKFVFAFQKLKYFSFFMAHFLHFITCAIYLGFEAMNIKWFCWILWHWIFVSRERTLNQFWYAIKVTHIIFSLWYE